ncbi:hypothetical protein [Parasporobacterium paucivorans]|uniref:SbsA Ig-like domain-containing protein n=1 Tax=Parasporobacterium paucivorans DSM 15970 TaxID=1122934 RepID=A0A1M6K6C7_9FIRM|nr:hypothetical protein [Parasporobacterium paucivorans]SHJ54518.1 hypothetical protein SAMN02745691_02135 [Parasporobacterium paucivorans DSM 15970]
MARLISIILCALLLVFPTPVSALEDGTGGGGGPGVPLCLDSVTLADGAEMTDTNTTFVLQYSHNVADASIRSNNRTAISVTTISGIPVQADISFSDTFALPYRQQVYVKPLGMEMNTTYVITIGPSFMSRNGYVTGTLDTLTFTTGNNTITKTSTVVEAPPAADTGGSQDSGTVDSAGNATGSSASAGQTGEAAENESANETSITENATGEPAADTEKTQEMTETVIQITGTEESAVPMESAEETVPVSRTSNLKPGKVTEGKSGGIAIIMVTATGLALYGTVTAIRRRRY